MPSLIAKYLKSRLLLPIFIALIGLSVLQAILVIGAARSNAGELKHDVSEQLSQSQTQISEQLMSANQQIDRLMHEMTAKTEEQLRSSLTLNLDQERQIIQESFEYSLEQSARTMANIIAQLAPPSIWDKDVPELTRMVQMAHETQNVVFAIFLDKDRNLLTRHLDRNHAKIKELISKSQVRGSVNKVLDAAPKDSELLLLDTPVQSRSVTIGYFILGISNQQIKAETQALQDRFTKLIANSNKIVTETMQREANTVAETLQASIKRVTERSEEALTSTNASMDKQSNQLTVLLTSIVVAAAGVMILVLVALLARLVLYKVDVLRTAIWGIATGDGDLTQRAHVKGKDEIADMAAGLNQFIASTQQIVAEVNHSADAAGAMTGQLANTATQANQAVGLQRRELEQVASAVSQMTSSIGHVAESIQHAANDVQLIRDDTGRTAKVSANVRQHLTALVDRMDQTTRIVTDLGQHCAEIGSIVGVIRGIAEQTNLLALNAAIEAARAGESGRGFAVVADEVRALASKTQQSTEEINNSIQNLQQGSQSAIGSINEANQMVQGSIDRFTESDQHLENVNQAVMKLFDMTSEIASMAEQQTHVAHEIDRNVVTIGDAAEQTSASVNHAAESSRDIDEVVRELKHKVSRFRV